VTTIAELQFKRISLQTGVRLHCGEAGPADGSPMLLHGHSDSWFSFSRILRLPPKNLRLVIPSQRGHGDSERPAGGYGTRQLAAMRSQAVIIKHGFSVRFHRIQMNGPLRSAEISMLRSDSFGPLVSEGRGGLMCSIIVRDSPYPYAKHTTDCE